jgi:hypothetical protein
MKLTVEIEHIKNIRTLKEWVIENGSPSYIKYSRSLKVKLNTPWILKRYIDKYTKEDLQFARRVVGKLLPMLRYNSAKEFKLYKDLYEKSTDKIQYAHALFRSAVKKRQPLAMKLAQRTHTVVAVTLTCADPYVYKVRVAKMPNLIWNTYIKDHTYEEANQELINSFLEKEYIKNVEIKSEIKADKTRKYMIAEILHGMIQKNPGKLNHIEHVAKYLSNLSAYNLEQIYERYYKNKWRWAYK